MFIGVNAGLWLIVFKMSNTIFWSVTRFIFVKEAILIKLKFLINFILENPILLKAFSNIIVFFYFL